MSDNPTFAQLGIDPEAWEGYLEMRKKIKKPMTKRAETIAIRKLEKLMFEGHDPNEVLDQSTFNSWQGLFGIKQETTAQDIAMGDTPFIAKHTRTDWSQ